MEALVRQQAVASTSCRCQGWLQRPQGRGRRRQVLAQAALDFGLWREGALPPAYKPPTVVPGARTLVTPRLSDERAFQRMLEAVHERAAKHYGAFYSSVLGGIVTSPGLMALHADDHMAHRGHGVYDVVPLVGGALYQLDTHVARALAAAESAGVPVELPADALKRILLDTAAASLKLNGHVFFWLTPGRGSLSVSTGGCTGPALYALVTSEYAAPDEVRRTDGWRAALSPVEPPSQYFGAFKSASGLKGCVAQVEAEAREYDVGLFIDGDGHVLGSPDASLAIFTAANDFVYAPFDCAPLGITVSTLAELIPENYSEDDLPVKRVERRPITVDDLHAAQEAVLVNSTLGVVPLTHIENKPVGGGEVGYLALALQAVLANDREPREGSGRHVPVPYGGLTGMRSQLT